MKSHKFSFVVFVSLLALACLSAVAQTEVFNDPTVDYTFTVPEEKWKMTVKPSATSPNVEYVYGDRSDGHLEIRRLTVPKDSVMTDVVQDEEKRVQFRQGFVAGREENFTGKLRGAIYNFEYVAAGRNMSGRFYFLKANDTTVYILRFTGKKDAIRSLRNQTDSIARTFGIRS